jgi:hypothetical protein
MPWPKGKKRGLQSEEHRAKRRVVNGIPRGPYKGRTKYSSPTPHNCFRYYYELRPAAKEKYKTCDVSSCLNTILDLHHLLPYTFFKKMYEQNPEIFFDLTLVRMYCRKHHKIEDVRLERELKAWKQRYEI